MKMCLLLPLYKWVLLYLLFTSRQNVSTAQFGEGNSDTTIGDLIIYTEKRSMLRNYAEIQSCNIIIIIMALGVKGTS